MTTLYMNPLGYTEQRPANFPFLDRSTLMVEAHRVAKAFRQHFGSYREALKYGLTTAHASNWSFRIRQSVALQCAANSSPALAARTSPRRRRPMLGHYGYAGA
jgi:hypothetical protein